MSNPTPNKPILSDAVMGFAGNMQLANPQHIGSGHGRQKLIGKIASFRSTKFGESRVRPVKCR
jgi:hypothetical protein